MKAGIPYIWKPGEKIDPAFMAPCPTEIPPAYKRRIQHKFDYRAVKDFGGKANFAFVPGQGTAYWKNNPDGTLDEIRMHEGLFSTVSSFGSGGIANPGGPCIPKSPRGFLLCCHKPGLYGPRTCEHEAFHALLTTWDIERFMVTDPKKGGYPPSDANIAEDAHIEDLGRQRRPGKPWMHRDGHEITVPSKADGGTYGIRKFDWWMWTGIGLTSPRNVLMAFITAERYKEIMDAIKLQFENIHGDPKLGNPDVDPSWYSKHLGRRTGLWDVWEFYQKYTNAGTGSGQIATSHDLHDYLCQFQEIWPARKNECGGGGCNGTGGRFGDIEGKATEMGIKPHPHAPEGEEGEEPTPPPTNPSGEGEGEAPEKEKEPKPKDTNEEVTTHDSAGNKDSNESTTGTVDMSEHVSEAELEPSTEEGDDPRADYDNDGETYPKQYFRKVVGRADINHGLSFINLRKLFNVWSDEKNNDAGQ